MRDATCPVLVVREASRGPIKTAAEGIILEKILVPVDFSDCASQGARYASVFAITAGAFVPLNFLAVRLAQPLIHPRTFSSTGGLPDSMLFPFLVCLVGMALLWATLVWFELDSKAASANLKRIRRALEATA